MSQSLDVFVEHQRLRAAQGLADGTSLRLLAFSLESGAVVGSFNLNNIQRRAALYADAGWFLDVRYLGKGYATEGVSTLLDIAFTPEPVGLGLHRVQAAVIPRNAASLAVAARCGFQREGIARKLVKINGVWEDHITFATLAEEHTVSTIQHS